MSWKIRAMILAACVPLPVFFLAAAHPRAQAGEALDSIPALRQHSGEKATVVVFLGVECPVANAYLPRLNQLSAKYEPRGLKILGVNANSQDSAERVAQHAKEFQVRFPVVKDEGSRIADALRAERTPEAFLLDAGGAVRYRGRIDDQYGVGVRKPAPTRADLAVAIDHLLAGQPVAVPRTAAAGCLISRPEKNAAAPITYSNQVARIMQKRCQSCHRAEGAAPFALGEYEQAKAWAKTIKEAVEARRMPPWHADPRYGKFLNDRSLPQEERETLLAWVESGAPEGDRRDLPPPVTFPKGWSIGEPDLVVRMPEEFPVPAEGVLPYKQFVVDPGFKEDMWVQRAEAKPGCSAVHHIILYAQKPGRPVYDLLGNTSMVCGQAPGDLAMILAPGYAKKIPAGSRLLFEIHYTPNGKPQRDRSSVALVFAKQPPKHEVRSNILANLDFRIPPGEPNHREEKSFSFPSAIRVVSFMPHMHLRGKSWEYRVLYADGRSETLLSVPRYDFNWQSFYHFAEPPLIPRGAKLQCIAHWDNSKDNPANPDPTKEVTFGLQTFEEMMNGWMEYVVEDSGSR
jgi:mono/diheme cytochrome c family protein/thiol-disulfide isomerase/thioredoxin